MGAATRKENVTPSGTPAVTNPTKSGTAEQEQKGVTTPRHAARTLPADSRLPERTRRVRSGVKKERITPTPKTTGTRSIRTLGVSKRKNSTAAARRSRSAEASMAFCRARGQAANRRPTGMPAQAAHKQRSRRPVRRLRADPRQADSNPVGLGWPTCHSKSRVSGVGS